MNGDKMDEYLYNIDLQISKDHKLNMWEMQWLLKNLKTYIEDLLAIDFVGGSVYPEESSNGNIN